jgi:hypothetical protein
MNFFACLQWDTANSKVSHKWLTTFEVLDDSQELLDVPIIGVNPFYLGAAAAVMRTVVATGAGQNPSDPASFRPTAQFPYLSDAYFQALFISGKLLTGILPVFSNPAGPFLTKTRASSVSSYAQFVPKFCQKAGLDFASAKIAWASATPYLSAAVPSYFTGFELPVALQSTNLTAVSDAVFDPLNQYSIASAAGLATWYCILIPSQCTLVPSPLYADVAAALFIDNPNADLPTISKWIGSLAQALPLAPNDVGSAYQKTVCAAISGQVQALRAAATVFSGIVANASEWSPSNWAEVGAMQFGSGFVVGSTISVPNLLQGIGVSVADLPSAKPADPLNFGDGNQLKEPIEFAGGLRYYIATNAPSAARPVNPKWPAGAQLAPLWQYNPALLYAYDVTTGATSTTAQITLNVKESAALIQLLLADTKIYGGLIQQLAPLVQAYAFVFQSCLQTQGPGQLQTCINQATGAVASQYDTLFPSAATSLYVFPPGNFAAGQVIVTKTNFFAIYVYLHQYLGHTFTGTLAEIDPVHGVGVQNSGLFTKRTVREMLFGYTNRYGQQIPPIAGPLLDASTFQKVLDQDYLDHQGRDYVQDTGHRDINTVGQWIQFEGVAKYQTHCDIDDPARTGSCSPAGSLQEAGNNWQVWGAPAVLAGSGSSLQIAPFGEDEVVEKTAFYVSEIRRPVVVEYKSDVTVKGIDLRRYGLWQALSNASFVTPNTEKNQEQWFQGGVPDGLYSMKTYQGGFSAMVSIPHFGDTDPKVWQGCTCDSGDCAQWYNDDLHATTIDIHPLTGLTMQGHKRLQANFKIDAHEFFTSVGRQEVVCARV